MAPSHGFAAASHGEAALRGAPASQARPRSEAQRGSVRPAAAMRSTHREMRCFAAVQAARYSGRPLRNPAGRNVTLKYLSHDGRPAPRRAARRHRTFADGKIPVARPGRPSVEFRLVREENGNALPGDRARRSGPGARQPLGRSEGAAAGPPSMRRAALWAAAVKCQTRSCGRRVRHGRRPEIRSGR
jgi:hypothetical protein